MNEKTLKSVSGFAVSGGLLTAGILMLFHLEGVFFNLVAYLFIVTSAIGFLLEMSEIVKETESLKEFATDFLVASVLGILFIVIWLFLSYFGFLNDWLKFFILMFSAIGFYGLYRGIFGALTIILFSENKKPGFDMLMQIAGLIIAFSVLLRSI